MSARFDLKAKVDDYLAERHRLGFKLENMQRFLASFTRYVTSVHHQGPLTVDLMANWARQDRAQSHKPGTGARRLKILRPFTRWLRQFEPRTEVPDESVFGPVPGRVTPHIYRETELVDLLAAARGLNPLGGLRPATYETLFGLIASTGLRVSEALALLDGDVELAKGTLTVRQTKFAKSRLLPLHPSTVEALTRYRQLRSRHMRTATDSPFFISTRGQLLGQPLGNRQSIGCSSNCGISWVGLTAAPMAAHAFTICATALPSAASCCGTSKASTSISRCWRSRLTWVTQKYPTPTGTSLACLS